MRTIEELERENRKLRSENELLNVKLAVAMRNECGIIEKCGEFHHQAFERLCPMPPGLDELTVKGESNII